MKLHQKDLNRWLRIKAEITGYKGANIDFVARDLCGL